MIGASLIVILFIVGALLNYQRSNRVDQIRKQGIGLVRLLSEMSYEQLVPNNARSGALRIIKQSQNDPLFAYAAVVDLHGKILKAISAAGVVMPAAAIPAVPSSWIGEQELPDEVRGQSVTEFFAPLMHDGKRIAHIRVGYFMPDYQFIYAQLPLFGVLALAVFLLTPLFYFLVKQEVRPLAQINSEIKKLLDKNSQSEVRPGTLADLQDFTDHFKRFMVLAQQRIKKLETEKSDVAMSSKILSYKKLQIESALQALPDAVIVIDERGTVTYANSKLHSLLDIDDSKIVGAKPADWFDSPDIKAFLTNCKANTARLYRVDSTEFIPDHASDKRFSISAFPLFSPKQADQLLGTILVLRDMTNEVAARQASSEFVAHVAHELKTPLNVLNMYSETLQDDGGESRELIVEAANVIHDEVERLAMLINNLLNMTRIEMGDVSLNFQRVKVLDLLKDALSNITRSAKGSNLEFEADMPNEMSCLSLDKDLLRVAINNLLTNAIKYNQPGGKVTLSAEETETDLLIRVTDTGIGINDLDREHIFDKFYRSENDEVRKRSGHGLGLSLAREIVQIHHGDLSVVSRPGEGSTFTIRFEKELALYKQAV